MAQMSDGSADNGKALVCYGFADVSCFLIKESYYNTTGFALAVGPTTLLSDWDSMSQLAATSTISNRTALVCAVIDDDLVCTWLEHVGSALNILTSWSPVPHERGFSAIALGPIGTTSVVLCYALSVMYQPASPQVKCVMLSEPSATAT